MTRPHPRAFLLLAVLSCARSPEPAFYTLTVAPGAALPTRRLRVELRRPTLPSYLDRPQIVTGTEHGRLSVKEGARWAAPLDSMVQQTLVEDLATRLPRAVVYSDSSSVAAQPDLIVDVELVRIEGDSEGKLELSAVVAVRAPSAAQSPAPQLARYALAGPERDDDVIAARFSALMGRLADVIAEQIQRVASNLPPASDANTPAGRTAPCQP